MRPLVRQMSRILVTGGSGLLGCNLVLAAIEDHDVVAVSRQHSLQWLGVENVQADLSEESMATQVLETINPDWVVHCAAGTNVDECERNPEWAFLLNREMASYVARAAHSLGARLVHISTDAVFDGVQGDYNEEATPNPISHYGQSKLEGEEAVKSAHPGAVVIRTNFYGWNALPKKSLAEWFLDHLETGRPCIGFSDVFVTPILANNFAEIILRTLEVKLEGVYHVGGSECVDKYTFGVRLAEVFGLDHTVISPSSVEAAHLDAPRSKKLCLDSTKISSALGVDLPDLADGMTKFKQLRDSGYADRLRDGVVSQPLA